MKTIGQLIQQEIDDRDLSQRRVTDVLGASQQTISRWAAGEAVPASRYIPAIAAFLGMPEKKVRAMLTEQRADRVQAKRGIETRLALLEQTQAELRAAMRDLAAEVRELKRPRHA